MTQVNLGKKDINRIWMQNKIHLLIRWIIYIVLVARSCLNLKNDMVFNDLCVKNRITITILIVTPDFHISRTNRSTSSKNKMLTRG
jgi:hypothetical protein